MTTPFEREILTHHWTGPTPFPRQTPLYWQVIERAFKLGLLRPLKTPNTYGCTIDGGTEAMRVYQAALAAVPFPVQKWEIPTP